MKHMEIILLHGNFTVNSYDEEGNVIYQTNSNGISITNLYTPTGRLKNKQPNISGFSPPVEFTSYTPSPTSSSEFAYGHLGDFVLARNDIGSIVRSYDSLGRMVKEQTDTSSITYQYDNLGPLTGITFPNGRKITFEYSLAGFLKQISQTSAGTEYPGDRTLPVSRVLTTIWRVGSRPLAIRFGDSHIANIAIFPSWSIYRFIFRNY